MLNPCGQCGGAPVEQTRGQMNPEDHHLQHKRHHAAIELAKFGVGVDVEGFRRDAYEVEDQGEEHATDMRVSCPECGNASGWDRRDIEEFREIPGNPGHKMRILKVPHGNVEGIRKRWNEDNPVN